MPGHACKVAGIVLGAGLSTRFGADKLSAPLHGKPLVHWALEAALGSSLAQVVVVARPGLAASLRETFPQASVVVNHASEQGQASSLRLGLAALGPEISHALFLLADQPLITPALIDSFVAAAVTGHDLAALAGEERPLPPTLFGRRYFEQLSRATGDAGGRGVLQEHKDQVLTLPPNFPLAGLDIDQPDHLAQAAMALGQGWRRALGLGKHELVSVAGAGGKTGLIHALASEAALAGDAVLATTTTKVFVPLGRLLVEQNPEALLAQARERSLPGWVLHVASDSGLFKGRRKLIGPEPDIVERLWARGEAPLLLAEADGARRLSLKAPRAHEPVITPSTTCLVGVMGLSTLGQPADENHVYGLAEFLAITKAEPGQAIEPRHAVALALHPEGLFKLTPPGAQRVVFLNQADAPQGEANGRAIAELISAGDSSVRVVLGSLRQGWAQVLAGA